MLLISNDAPEVRPEITSIGSDVGSELDGFRKFALKCFNEDNARLTNTDARVASLLTNQHQLWERLILLEKKIATFAETSWWKRLLYVLDG